MKRVGKNSVALGLVMLLISAAMAFSAQGAPTYTSYAEAQYVAAADNALGGQLVDPLVDAVVEDPTKGGQACEPATATCPESAGTSSPLGDALLPVTGALGDAVGGGAGVGVIGNYAKAGGGASQAASGAVSNEGAIDLASAGDASKTNASFALSNGALSPIAAAVADARLEIGAVAATAKLDSPTSEAVRDYGIAGADLVLDVPALGAINSALGGVPSTDLPADVTINITTLCDLVGGVLMGSLGELAPGVPLPEVNLCEQVPSVVDGLLQAKITGLNAVTEGLTNITKDGITFDFTEGEIRIDLAAAAEAALGTDINNLPANTELLAEILPSLALNLDDLIGSVYDDLVDQLLTNLDVEVTLLGAPLPLPVGDLSETVLNTVLEPVFTSLETALLAVGDPLSEALGSIVDGLGPLLKLVVNVPDVYATDVAAKRDGGIVPASAGVSTQAVGDSAGPASETALRILVGNGALADLLLGNALVGPNTQGPDDDADAAQAGDGPADNDAVQDADTDIDNDSSDNDVVADSDADSQADAVSGSDADAVADADVTSALPNTGSSNVLPLVLLALGLIGFGAAVLINERRRMALQV